MTRFLLLAAVSLALAPAAAAQELGRLFFTPEQRAALDARRKARVPDKSGAAVVSPTTRLDGYVQRSQGPSTVFMNGESLLETSPEAPRIGVTRREDGRVSVPVGESGARVGLRPGETLDRGSGEVRDVIGDGRIRVKPSKPAP